MLTSPLNISYQADFNKKYVFSRESSHCQGETKKAYWKKSSGKIENIKIRDKDSGKIF